MHTVLLLSDKIHHRRGLAQVISALEEFQLSACQEWNPPQAADQAYDMVIADYPCDMARQRVPQLRRLYPHAKLLALAPFSGRLPETRLVSLGADDVLRLPVTRERLTVTLRNLVRIAALERQIAGPIAAVPSIPRGQ